MAGAKEIRTKIGSIKNTQKITQAMGLVAASKMKKAQESMSASRPYAKKIKDVVAHVATCHTEYVHPYLRKPETIKNIGLIIVGSDRGLCGGLNINLFRSVVRQLKDWQNREVSVQLALIGHKANTFFSRFKAPIVGVTEYMGDAPSLSQFVGVVKALLEQFDQGKLDAIYLASNEFVNTMTQKPRVVPLLPIEPGESRYKGHWDYIYEPDAANVILDQLLVRYIESQVYQAVVENLACFQAAQMVAMKSATDNAGQLIDELQTMYNKVRQAGITREIAEIVSGAAAIE